MAEKCDVSFYLIHLDSSDTVFEVFKTRTYVSTRPTIVNDMPKEKG